MPEAAPDAVRVTVILPAHNEADTVADTVRGLRELYPDYEILVVDDASADETGPIAERAGARVVRNRVNQGYGAALKRGMRQARGEIVVFMDADRRAVARGSGRGAKAG